GVAATDVVADVTGAYAETDEFGGVVPARLLDTRAKTSATVGTTVDGEGEGSGKIPAVEYVTLQVTGRGNIPEDAKVVAINITNTEAEGPGFLTVWACDQERPVASSLNYLDSSHAAANSVVVDLSAEGTLCIYAGASATHV